MILFHSVFCEHCVRLLEVVKRHDTNHIIKLVSIDTLKTQNFNFEHTIHSVPAMYFPTTKEIIYGKAVFDYLLLPGRGKLLVNNNTKERDPDIKKDEFEGEPMGFTLSNVISQTFENINENEKDEKTDLNFKWTPLNDNVVTENTGLIDKVGNSDENDKKMPSMEAILAEREKALNGNVTLNEKVNNLKI
tara:strand:- start:2827 stop:3396 length:570 start_codon:yes stop_codon:yes gene_type:complete